jgi:hypothetical protein
MMDIRDIVSLDVAADELGVTPIALFARASRGIIWAGLVGTTWVTTQAEVERYRRENLGPVGRPITRRWEAAG